MYCLHKEHIIWDSIFEHFKLHKVPVAEVPVIPSFGMYGGTFKTDPRRYGLLAARFELFIVFNMFAVAFGCGSAKLRFV
jgi:hypothetical protein